MTFSQDFLSKLRDLLLYQEFLDKVILLLLAAGISGFLIPWILKEIDASKLQAKMKYEADLRRSENIVNAQINLLENISESLWELQLLSLSVCYYKVHSNSGKYEAAKEDYDLKSWDLFRKIRLEISKSARLVSNDLYDDLLVFFKENLIQKIDETLIVLIQERDENSMQAWKNHYDFLLYELPVEIDEKVITPLAKELRLLSAQKTQKRSH